MIPMSERVCQAGDKAVGMLMDIHIKAAAEAFQALAALKEDEFSGPDLAEAKRRIGNTLRLLLTGER